MKIMGKKLGARSCAIFVMAIGMLVGLPIILDFVYTGGVTIVTVSVMILCVGAPVGCSIMVYFQIRGDEKMRDWLNENHKR